MTDIDLAVVTLVGGGRTPGAATAAVTGDGAVHVVRHVDGGASVVTAVRAGGGIVW